jgi:hypothetical protein
MDFSVLSKCDARRAHNPDSEAGSLVQIQRPQPTFRKPRSLIAFMLFRTSAAESISTMPVILDGLEGNTLGIDMAERRMNLSAA